MVSFVYDFLYLNAHSDVIIDVLVVQLNSTELNELAQKTRLVINCVGPYHLYSTPVVEACAVNGTHYVDV